jgi:hypothetical protein
MELDPNVMVAFGEKNLDNPGLVDEPYRNRAGTVVINVWFDFAEIPAIAANPVVAAHGGATEDDVIGHETYAHAQPKHEGWRCRDATGCARGRENVIRGEMHHRPRTF